MIRLDLLMKRRVKNQMKENTRYARSSESESRRGVLAAACRVLAGSTLLPLAAGCGKANGPEQACVDPNDLPFGQRSLREANNYVEVSTTPQKQCLDCAYFSGEPAETSEPATCGNCEIFAGIVNKNGFCDSWSARDGAAG